VTADVECHARVTADVECHARVTARAKTAQTSDE
jgi:hypothetical protein